MLRNYTFANVKWQSTLSAISHTKVLNVRQNVSEAATFTDADENASLSLIDPHLVPFFNAIGSERSARIFCSECQLSDVLLGPSTFRRLKVTVAVKYSFRWSWRLLSPIGGRHFKFQTSVVHDCSDITYFQFRIWFYTHPLFISHTRTFNPFYANFSQPPLTAS